ncbi:RNA-directed DNA polymerase [Vibrio sp. Vb1554]|uniref:RNA-directed DNA polymerase n=2 Tax=Vibrio TaxID=662 RepID=UPI0021CF6ADB|nr:MULTISPECIES: RNA-directed DNA polymerase [unclassified Vibrio]MDW2109010.1 RNA-directed DNA polymerase [Vibrio sp. 2089]MDW3048170.1 RNA-directed DNA polymerase [Vibrio sp. Vb1554]
MEKIETQGLFSEDDIELAWERVCASVGSDVKDYFGINVFSSNISLHLKEMFDELDENQYTPSKPFKYFEPKKCGTQRTKTVLNIKDAIVYQAIADKIGYLLYDKLSNNNDYVFGSVLNENVQKGVDVLDDDEPDFYFFEYYVSLYNRFVEGIENTIDSGEVQYKLETDITGFFDCIPHSVLLIKLFEYGIDKKLLDVLSVCLNTWSGTRDSITLHVGIPQGPSASFLLANILLDKLDDIIVSKGLNYFRFMDDIRIYSYNRSDLLKILVEIDRHLKGLSLSLNASKTDIKVVNTENNVDDFILDGSGIPFEEGEIDWEDESEIDIEQIASDELVIQDETQFRDIKGTSHSYGKNTKIALYLLKNIESDLLDLYRENKYIEEGESLPTETIREFLTLSQRWRSLVPSLKDDVGYIPNKDLIDVWFFGVEHIYWKANSMVWNFGLYDSLESHHHRYERTLIELDRFEWVKYQLLSVFYKFYPNDLSKHAEAIDVLSTEKSPLVRLGYYSVLVESITENSELFERYSQVLKSEINEYVKTSILNSIHYNHTQVSIDNLKEWFLK